MVRNSVYCKISLPLIMVLSVCYSRAQLLCDTALYSSGISYCVMNVRDYSFNELLNEGINTMAKQLAEVHAPVKAARPAIKGYIKRHHFILDKKTRRKTSYRVINFEYPSHSPSGEPILLSGTVTVPILNGNRPQRMLVYHRILVADNSVSPSNSLPIEAVLSADNTICVFPDYYGCGVTEGCSLPYAALNYHACCAAECALAALEILQDSGCVLDTGFYSWNTGYSQAGGYALAMHRFIEDSLSYSAQKRLNLRWSFCVNGAYMPSVLYQSAILNGDMGDTPSVFLQGLQGLFVSHSEQMDTLSVRDFLSDKALSSGMDSILNTYNNGLWGLVDKLDGRDKSHNPADYFSPSVLDTATDLYKTLMSVLKLDDCASGWSPQSCVVLCSSRNDHLIPYHIAEQTYNQLSSAGGCCYLHTPKINSPHFLSGFFYFLNLLHYNENELYERWRN